MKTLVILGGGLALIAATVSADTSILENIATQAAKDTAQAVAPQAVENAEKARQNLETIKTLKDEAAAAPDALKKQALDSITAEKQKAAETQKAIKDSASQLKKKIKNAPEATKQKLKQEAARKTLELLQ